MMRLQRYAIRHLVTGFVLVGGVLVALMGLFDLAEQLEQVGDGAYRFDDALRHAAFRLPARFVDMAPFIGLLGGLVGLGLMNAHHELTAMAAAGMGPARLFNAGLVAAAMLVVVQSVCVGLLGPWGEQARIRQERVLTNEGMTADSAFWSRDENLVLRIGSLRHGRVPEELEIFELDGSDRLARYVHARRVTIAGPQRWQLEDVAIKRFDQGDVTNERRESVQWEPFLDADRLSTLQLPAETLAPHELLNYIDHLVAADREVERYRLMLWRKASMLMMTITMTLLAVPFATRGTPRSSPAGHLLIGALAGIGIYIGDQILVRLLDRLALPEPLIAMGPSFALAATVIAIAAWQRRFA